MNGLGLIWGAKTVTAPDVHMFYGRVRVGRPVSAKLFNDWVSRHPTAMRQFSDPADATKQLAVHVIGTGAARMIDAIATAADLIWFANGWIVPGTTLPPPPAPWPIAGMDTAGHRYALPAEDDYESHLTAVTVLATPPSLRGP
jgi:hypothetical protein